jgi:hypothetical protein
MADQLRPGELPAAPPMIVSDEASDRRVPHAIVIVELPFDEARALAKLVKRLVYDDAERLSSPYDGGEERDAMLNGIDKLRRGLAEAGFAPR